MDLYIKPGNGPITFEGHLAVLYMVSALRVGHEGFTSSRNPFTGSIDLLCDPRDNHFFRVMKDLAPKSTAYIWRDDLQLMLIQHGQGNSAQTKTDDVRILTGGPDCHILCNSGPLRSTSSWFHCVGNQTLIDQVQFDYMIRFFEGLVTGLPISQTPFEADIIFDFIVNKWFPIFGGCLSPYGGFQHFIVHFD